MIKYTDTQHPQTDIANELAEMNRLKRLELKMKYQIPEFDLNEWQVVDKA